MIKEELIILEEGKIYKEAELVELIGTDSQKDHYKKNGRFVGNARINFLNKLNKLCTYKTYKNKRYRITQVYEYPVPANINKLASGMYQYMIPSIIQMLLNAEHNRLQFTLDQWAIEMKMIKDTYHSTRIHKEYLTNAIQNSTYQMAEDFFTHSYETLRYYFNQSLNMLQKNGNIKVYIIPMVYATVTEIDELGQETTSTIMRDATEQERIVIEQFLKELDEELDIKNDWQRFYSEKAEEYKQRLNEFLHTLGLEMYFSAYELYARRPKQIQILLQQINDRVAENVDTDIHGITIDNAYANMIMDNTMKRYDKDTKHKYEEIYNNREKCKEITQKFCEYTIIR